MSKLLRVVCVLAVALMLFDVAMAKPGRRDKGRERGRWELLGERTVSDKIERDTIPVTRAEGIFNALQLRVSGHAVEFHSIVVHFANGDDQEIEVREAIPAGRHSRVIDLEGGGRIIKSVEFKYDARKVIGGKPVVRLFGRH